MVTKNYTAPLRTMLMTILKTEFNSNVSFLSSRLDNDNSDKTNIKVPLVVHTLNIQNRSSARRIGGLRSYDNE